MTRIPYPDPETLTPEVRATLEKLPLNIVRMSANASPAMFEAQGRLGSAAAGDIALPPNLRETAILRVAHLANSAYELYHHLAIARALKMPEAVLDALARQDYAALDADTAAVAAFVDDLVVNVSPSDKTLAALRSRVSDRAVMDLVLLVGLYMCVARVIAVGGIELDASALAALPK